MTVMEKPKGELWQYTAQTFLYFDIETIPTTDPATMQHITDAVTAPASYKKPESIAKWLDENREAAAADAIAKTSFDAGAGHVCTIAWAKNTGDVKVAHAETIDEEASVLSAFFADFDEYHSETLVGHNIVGFDLPFLLRRAVVLGVTLPDVASFPRDIKPWARNVNDTMAMWAGSRGRISMDALCGALGIAGKEGFDGSQVADAWREGRHDTIREYCADDVSKTRLIHQAFLRAGW